MFKEKMGCNVLPRHEVLYYPTPHLHLHSFLTFSKHFFPYTSPRLEPNIIPFLPSTSSTFLPPVICCHLLSTLSFPQAHGHLNSCYVSGPLTKRSEHWQQTCQNVIMAKQITESSRTKQASICQRPSAAQTASNSNGLKPPWSRWPPWLVACRRPVRCRSHVAKASASLGQMRQLWRTANH